MKHIYISVVNKSWVNQLLKSRSLVRNILEQKMKLFPIFVNFQNNGIVNYNVDIYVCIHSWKRG